MDNRVYALGTISGCGVRTAAALMVAVEDVDNACAAAHKFSPRINGVMTAFAAVIPAVHSTYCYGD